jgi:hypothetical protein
VGLAATAAAVAALALPAGAGAFIYWPNGFAKAIGRANNDGTGVNNSFVSTAVEPCGVASNGSYVYWTGGAEGHGVVGRANLSTRKAEDEFIVTASGLPCGVAVDASHVYFNNYTKGAIGRANLEGGEIQQEFITGGTNPQHPSVDGTHIFWTNKGFNAKAEECAPGCTVGEANLNGTSVNQELIKGTHDPPSGTASDGTHFYWGNGATIGRANVNGSSPEPSFIATGGFVCAVAVGGGYIYWAHYGGKETAGSIGRARLDGSELNDQFIATSGGTCGVAVDSNTTPPPALVPSTTELNCNYFFATFSDTCTATVRDAGKPPGPTPTGEVNFSASEGGLRALRAGARVDDPMGGLLLRISAARDRHADRHGGLPRRRWRPRAELGLAEALDHRAGRGAAGERPRRHPSQLPRRPLGAGVLGTQEDRDPRALLAGSSRERSLHRPARLCGTGGAQGPVRQADPRQQPPPALHPLCDRARQLHPGRRQGPQHVPLQRQDRRQDPAPGHLPPRRDALGRRVREPPDDDLVPDHALASPAAVNLFASGRIAEIDAATSDHDYLQGAMRLGDAAVVVVLGDDWQPVLDRSRGNQRVGEPYRSVDTGTTTVGHEVRPRNHRRLADRYWVCGSRDSEGVRAAGPGGGIPSSQDAELKLADRDDRHRHVWRELSERPAGLAGNEYRGVQQTAGGWAHSSSSVWPTSSSRSCRRAGSAARLASCRRSSGPESQRARRSWGTMSATGSPCTVSVTRSPARTASITRLVWLRKSRTPISMCDTVAHVVVPTPFGNAGQLCGSGNTSP